MGRPPADGPLIGPGSAVHHLLMVGTAAWLIATAVGQIGLSALYALAGGWTTLSLVAYSIHRFVFHGRGPLARAHAQHHADPHAEQLDFVSYVGPMAIILAAWLLVIAATGSTAVAHGIAAGGCLGYSWFRLVHRLVHAPERPAFIERYVAMHTLHHEHPAVNFSVTIRFWDRLLGTLHRDEASRPTGRRTNPPMPRAAGASPPFPVALTDPCPTTDAPRNALERAFVPWLRDIRDLAFVRTLLGFCASVPVLVILLFALPDWAAGLLAPAYLWILYAIHGGPAMLMVHAVAHRPTFRGPGRVPQAFIRHGLLVFYGISPFAYAAHHLVMHHGEENAAADTSSTLGHVRDSPREFARYALRFLLFGPLHMTHYLGARRQWRALGLMWLGEAGFLSTAALLLPVAPVAVAATMLAPYVLTRFFLMAGNWAQHAFVDPHAPEDGVRSATVLVNCAQNARCFNDGYHAVHHRYRGMHWADMSAHFRDHWPEYAQHGVIVFAGIANQQVVWWRLMRGDYGYLADHMPDLGVLPGGRENRIRLLQERARRVLIPPKGMLELREKLQTRRAPPIGP
jgi:sterol desaturase/sphingolipid hydroxylase (fatty acid hydroxylase superfamily)